MPIQSKKTDIDLLHDHIRHLRQQTLIVYKDHSYTSEELSDQIDAWEGVFSSHALSEGMVIGIVSENPCPLALSLLLFLTMKRCIVIPLSTENKAQHERYFDISTCQGVFVFDSDTEWRFVTRVVGTAHELIDQLREKNEAGLILFSSGTSGEAKAILLQTSRLLSRHRESPRKKYTAIVFLKMNHIGGINTFFSCLFSGSTLVMRTSNKVGDICALIEKYRIELLPTSPTFLNMLLMSDAVMRYDLSSLKLITYGTEPMPTSTLEALYKHFPMVRLKQTYGLTELGIFATKSKDSSSTLIKLGSEDGVEYRIENTTLRVRSKYAMMGYLNAPFPFDSDGWFDTEDVVEQHGEYIRILGRKSDLINVGGEKVYPSEVESILLTLENIDEVLVCGKANRIMGEIVVAYCTLHVPEDPHDLELRISRECRHRLEPYQIPSIVTVVETMDLVNERFKKVRKMS